MKSAFEYKIMQQSVESKKAELIPEKKYNVVRLVEAAVKREIALCIPIAQMEKKSMVMGPVNCRMPMDSSEKICAT